MRRLFCKLSLFKRNCHFSPPRSEATNDEGNLDLLQNCCLYFCGHWLYGIVRPQCHFQQ